MSISKVLKFPFIHLQNLNFIAYPPNSFENVISLDTLSILKSYLTNDFLQEIGLGNFMALAMDENEVLSVTLVQFC